jgi:hypothetical protein
MIVLPAEVLTTDGFVDIKNLNIINHKICTFNTNSKSLFYEKPLGIYVQPLSFRIFTMQNQHAAFFLDESHNRQHIALSATIQNTQIGSAHPWHSKDFLVHATYDQCINTLKKLLQIDPDAYSPTVEGCFTTNDFSVASAIQRIALHCNVACYLKCSPTYESIECVIGDDYEPLQCFGPYAPSKGLYAVNITTRTGAYVIRVSMRNEASETIYSTVVI